MLRLSCFVSMHLEPPCDPVHTALPMPWYAPVTNHHTHLRGVLVMPMPRRPLSSHTRLFACLTALLIAFACVMAIWPAATWAQQGNEGVVDASIPRLNVRSEPSSDAAIIAKLPAGSSVTVLASDATGQWLRVKAEGLSGDCWVAAEFVRMLDATTASLPTASLPTASLPTPTVASTDSTTVSEFLGGGLVGAATGGSRHGNRATATATTVASGVKLPTPTAEATGETAAGSAVSATPGSTAAPLSTPATAAALAVAQTAGAEAATAPEPDSATAYVVPASMNVRSGPGTNYDRAGAASQGTALAITGINPGGDWYRVALSDGSEGWVSAGLVTTAGPMGSVKQLTGDEIPAAPVAPAASVASAAPASVASAPAPSGGGGFGYGVTANMWQSDKAAVANALIDLGFDWVKQQVRWEFVETAPGAINWQEMDGIVNTMNGYGRNVAFSIVTAPAWTRPTKGGTNGPPEDFNSFAGFLGQVAGRYCGQSLKAIEVWNEQNLQREWEGFPLDPAIYMDLLKRAYTSIKAACPSMIVVSGAPTPAGYSDVAFDDIDYLRGMYQNGLARYSDAVGIHPSGFGNPPNVRFSDWQSGAYNAPSHVNHRSFYFLSTLEESRAVMVQFGDTAKRLWPTEFGWGSTPSPYPGYEYQGRISEQQQAQWITDAFRIMANSGYVGATFLWNLNYNFGEMQSFSIIGRPAYAALKTLTGR